MRDHPAPIVTTEHVQRAYAQLRKPGWPPLEVMQSMANQMAIVRGRASDLAHGRTLPAEPVAQPAPAPQPHSARALGHTERRRRDDQAGAIDLKRRAAGEKDEDA